MCFLGMVSHSSWFRVLFVLLPSEDASFWKACSFSCRLTEDSGVTNTQNDWWCMAKDGGDFIAAWAFHLHRCSRGWGSTPAAFLLVFLLCFWRDMKEILGERLVLVGRSSPPEGLSLLSYLWNRAGDEATSPILYMWEWHKYKRIPLLTPCIWDQ